MKLLRPNDFETSLDIALSPEHTMAESSQTNNDLKHIKDLDDKFWNVFFK